MKPQTPPLAHSRCYIYAVPFSLLLPHNSGGSPRLICLDIVATLMWSALHCRDGSLHCRDGSPQSTSHPTAVCGHTGPCHSHILSWQSLLSLRRRGPCPGKATPQQRPQMAALSLCEAGCSLHLTWFLLVTINSQIRSLLPFHVQKP